MSGAENSKLEKVVIEAVRLHLVVGDERSLGRSADQERRLTEVSEILSGFDGDTVLRAIVKNRGFLNVR